jgi:hypothetical protein
LRPAYCLSIIVLLAATACARTSETRSRDAIASTVSAWAAAVQDQNLEALSATLSPAFEHPEWGDRAGAIAFMQQAIEMGYLEGVEIELPQSQTTLEAETAVVAPVALVGTFGSLTATIRLAREGRAWLITGIQFEG